MQTQLPDTSLWFQRRSDLLAEPTLEGSVVALTADRQAYASEHEHATRAQLAWRIARLRKSRFEGEYEATRSYAAPVYFVPSDTLVGHGLAESLGIAGPHHLFGGVVHESFVRTKAIAHPVVDELAVRPEGWRLEFAERIEGAVLDGYSAFTLHDAARAGRRMLQHGEARLKPVRATAGRGQVVVQSVDALDGGIL